MFLLLLPAVLPVLLIVGSMMFARWLRVTFFLIPRCQAYAAAKGGLKMLTRSMATEWARYNIQVNGIGPGYFATSQTAPLRVAGNPFHEFIVHRTPAGRWGEPGELGGAVVFLASAAADFVNGQILYVDGGILATIGRPAGS